MGSNIPSDHRLSLPSSKTPNHDGMSGLYWTMHEFDCKQQHVLSFKKNQVVEVTKASSSTNWHRGRIDGRAGFLPANGYLKRINLEKCSKVVVRQDFDESKPGQLKVYEGQVVFVIVKNDLQWWTVRSDTGKWGLVPAKCLKVINGTATNGEVTVHSPIESPDIVVSQPPLSKREPSVPVADMNSVPRPDSKTPDSEGCTNHKDKRKDVSKIAYDLVEGVRRKGIKYQTSKEIVNEVLEKLMVDYPEWDSQLSELCTSTALNRECEIQSTDPDLLKLEQLFEHLATMTDDDQQRGWICEDDTAEISSLLKDLLNLLRNANPRVVNHVMQTLKYEPLFTLVQYYQLEERVLLKRLSLEVMLESMMIQPDPVCSILLTSRIPVQLATDIQASKVMSLIEQQCNVFCACLSYPNIMPANHYDQLDATFISYLLSTIEAPDIPFDPDSLVPALFLKCLLALNLHYKDLRGNKICSVLKSRSSATNLTELLLLHFNRAEDPKHFFPECAADSVKKLVSDMFSSPDTAELFFTNDVKVLIEVLHRNIIDRPHGDKERVYYLRTLDLVLTNTDYQDHMHYNNQIFDLLRKIEGEDNGSTDCQTVAKRMLKKHSCLSS